MAIEPEEALSEQVTSQAAAGTAERADADVEEDDAGPVAVPIGRSAGRRRRSMLARGVAYVALPVLAIMLASASGYLKWRAVSEKDAQLAAAQSVQAAKDGTIALLSYRPESVDADLGGARARLTGAFLDSYTSLTHDVVIPGAKQRDITTVATVPAVASLSADNRHAVAMVFVDQSTTVGNDAPTQTASTVKVTLDKVGSHWLISGFDPI